MRNTCVVLAAVSTGCLVSYGGGTAKIDRTQLAMKAEVRPEALSGTTELGDDGTVRFTFGTDQLCKVEHTYEERAKTVTHAHLNTGGRVMVGAGVVAEALGTWLLLTIPVNNATNNGARAGHIAGGVLLDTVAGLALFLPPLIARLGSPSTLPVPGFALEETKLQPKQSVYWRFKILLQSDANDQWLEGTVSKLSLDDTIAIANAEGKVGALKLPRSWVRLPTRTKVITENGACPPGVLGALTLITPWGASFGPIPVTANRATFAVDWGAVDPSDRGRIAGPWVVKHKDQTIATKLLNDAEIGRAIAVATTFRNRDIHGATPARLATAGVTVDSGSLIVGGTATVRITVENQGQSTARDVVVKTRSSLAQLSDLSFKLGVIQPGGRATQAVTVTLPETVPDDDATLLLTFTEATGQVPANVSQQIKITRSVCKDGKLTRDDYKKKRDKLKAALDSGSISRDDFNKLDAELLGCLK